MKRVLKRRLAPLLDFSLVTENAGSFSLHHLIHLAMRTLLDMHKKLERCKENAVRLISKVITR